MEEKANKCFEIELRKSEERIKHKMRENEMWNCSQKLKIEEMQRNGRENISRNGREVNFILLVLAVEIMCINGIVEKERKIFDSNE